MSIYMNDFDLDEAISRFGRGQTPNRLGLALVVNQLRLWTDTHSDGWAYWDLPKKAAQRAMEQIESRTSAANRWQEQHDITDGQLREYAQPIERFLKRQKADPRDIELVLRGARPIEAP